MAFYGFQKGIEILPSIPAGATPEQMRQVLQDVVDRLNTIPQTQLYIDDTGLPRILIGYKKDAWGAGKHFGILVSNTSVDVTTITSATAAYSLNFL